MPQDPDPALDATLAPSDAADPTSDAAVIEKPPRVTSSDSAAEIASLEAASSTRLALPSYDLGPLLGRGGMGDVVLGYDSEIGRDVAIKQLRTPTPTPMAIARFLREARIQARLEHPSIVPVHQIGHDKNGRPYFTMKKLTGRTLAEQLVSTQQLPRQRLLRIFAEACSGIELAHARGVVHRDLKPANIMIGDFGEVYVLDWGLARIVSEHESSESSISTDGNADGMTQAGARLGTPGYMAPEQIEDPRQVGPAADVYSLGSILFEILTGTALHPRRSTAVTSTLEGVTEGPAQRCPDRNVPPELDALCSAALATDPLDRPSVKELAERLLGYLDGDRDVAQRRALAAVHLARAREAMTDPKRRAEAIQALGRALVLDPESTDAATALSGLVFEQPTQPPAELVAELTASEVTVQRKQGRVALASFVVVLGYLAIAAANGVLDLPLVLAIAAYTVAHAAVVWRITQRVAGTGEMLLVAGGNALLAALLSRTLGSMIIVPAVTCIMALSLTSYPRLIDRKWSVIGLLVASWIVPVALEQVGVLTPTWSITGNTVALSSATMVIGGRHTAALLIGSNIVTIVVFGLFSSALATSRRNAMRQTEIQAWNLRQLLPTR